MTARVTALIFATVIAAAAGCSSAVPGVAEAGHDTSIESSAPADDPAEEPTEDPATPLDDDDPAGEADDDQAAPDQEPGSSGGDGAAGGDVDAATLEWSEGACIDVMTLMQVVSAAPDVDRDTAPDDFAIATMDHYMAIGGAIEDILVEARTRPAPGIPRGDEVHGFYIGHLADIGAAVSEGAVDIELMYRSGSPEDLSATIARVEAEVDELISSDFTGDLVHDDELDAAMSAAMDLAPSCQMLG